MDKLIKIFSTPNARSSAFYYLGNFAVSVSRYFFHLILLRLLVPSEYGEFLSYLSLTYLLGIPMGTIGTVVTKFVSDYKGRGDEASINRLFYFLLKKMTPIVLFIGSLLIIFSSYWAVIFKAHPAAFVVLGVSVFISPLQTVISSYVVAFQKFVFQAAVNLGGVVVTILLSLCFVSLGMGATGAVLGQILAGVVVSLILFLPIRHSIVPSLGQTKKFNLSGFTGYSFVFALGTASLISTDVLLVRVLFESHSSGLYSSLSVLGRMILFGLTPINSLILPLAAHRHAKNAPTRPILIKLGAVMFLFATVGTAIFYLLPGQIIRLLSGTAYLEVAPLLPRFALSMSLFALSQLLITYLMAVGRPRITIALLFVTLLQPLLILTSAKTLTGVVAINLGLSAVLFIFVSLFALGKNHHRQKHI